MTDLERFNLFWLCHAMTAPVNSEESYYFDGQTKKFFSSGSSGLLDMVDLSLISLIAEDIGKRMADIDATASKIVDIPRLNVQDKVAVQLLFLSKLSGVVYEDALRIEAEKQQDIQGFVLDFQDSSAINL